MALEVRPARASDLPKLNQALRALSQELGDNHLASDSSLDEACFGELGFASAILACSGAALMGLTLFTPAFSTTIGGPGVMVSDLWVAAEQRGAGLGRRLLAATAQEGAKRWGAIFLKLSVYKSSPSARSFYEHLGFDIRDRERNALLAGKMFESLSGDPL